MGALFYFCCCICATAVKPLMYSGFNWCRALTAWFSNREGWEQLVHRVMEQDWSWSEPALDYIELYYKALKRV